MDNEKSAVSEFLNGLDKSPEDPFKSPDPFVVKTEEKKSEDKEESVDDKSEDKEEKVLPFHKDPKVQRYVEKEIKKALAGVTTKDEVRQFVNDTKGEEPSELMDALVGLIGNDTPEKQRVLKAFEKGLNNIEVNASERAMNIFKEQEQQQIAEDQRAQEELDSSFEEIEDTYGVDLSSNTAQSRKTRSDFIEYVRKIAPKNEDGEVASFPDMNSAFETFQELSKKPNPATARSKDLASRGISRSSDTTTTPTTTGKSWKDVDKLFSRITN